jgi:hypothetical protein
MKFKICLIVCLFTVTILAAKANPPMKSLSISDSLKNLELAVFENDANIKAKRSFQRVSISELNRESTKSLPANRRKNLENYYNGEWLLRLYSPDGSSVIDEFIVLIDNTSIFKSGLGICLLTVFNNNKTVQYSRNAGLIGYKGSLLDFALPIIEGSALVQIALPISAGNAYYEFNRDCTILDSNGVTFTCTSKPQASEVLNVALPLSFEKIR